MAGKKRGKPVRSTWQGSPMGNFKDMIRADARRAAAILKPRETPLRELETSTILDGMHRQASTWGK